MEGPPADALLVFSTEDIVGLRNKNPMLWIVGAFVMTMSVGGVKHNFDIPAYYIVLSYLLIAVGLLLSAYGRKREAKAALSIGPDGLHWNLDDSTWDRCTWADLTHVDITRKLHFWRRHYTNRRILRFSTRDDKEFSFGFYESLELPSRMRRLAAIAANRLDPKAIGPGIQDILKDPEHLSDK